MRPPRALTLSLLVALAPGRSAISVTPPARAAPPPPTPAAPAERTCDLPPPLAAAAAVYGSALARSPDGARLAAVDEDADAVVLLARSGHALVVERRITVGRRPSQALLSADTLWVVERGDGTLGVYDLADGRRRCRIPVARDPVSFARTADGATLLVAATLPPRLIGVDARRGRTRFEAPVLREPRGLWVSPSGDRVVLSHLAGDPLSAVELRGDVATPRALPPFGRRTRTEHACVEMMEGCTTATLFESPSQAWSITEDAPTGRLLVPMMTSTHHAEGDVFGGGSYGGGSGVKTTFRLGVFDPATLTWSDDPPLRLRAHVARLIAAPVASALTPDGDLVVLSQAHDRAAVLPRDPRVEPRAPRSVDAPDAVSIAPDGEVLVHSLVDHAVEYGPAEARVRVVFGDEPRDPRVALGRRLFLSASPRLSGFGMSCASCHPDGRDDGITWDFNGARLRTPTLAGRSHAPWGWLGQQATLADAVRVAIARQGGSGVSADRRDALAAYVERGLAVPRDDESPLSASAIRGRRVFHEGAACARCHDEGAAFVDGANHRLGASGAPINTPSLAGVTACGPWFHDGRYDTLGAVLADAHSGMGEAHALTAGDRDDLLAWLATL